MEGEQQDHRVEHDGKQLLDGPWQIDEQAPDGIRKNHQGGGPKGAVMRQF